MTHTGIVVWSAFGVLIGIFHAFSLRRATRRPPHALSTILRLASVAALLIAAAFLGWILPAASGWACGFPITTAALYFRRPS